jgi:hypothetical protein
MTQTPKIVVDFTLTRAWLDRAYEEDLREGGVPPGTGSSRLAAPRKSTSSGTKHRIATRSVQVKSQQAVEMTRRRRARAATKAKKPRRRASR